MPISARGDEAHQPPVLPDRLETAGIRVALGQLERHDGPRGTCLAFFQRGLLADEVLRPVDPAVHAGFARRIALGEFPAPDAEALLKPQRQKRVVADLAQAQAFARVDQRAAQRDMFRGTAMDLVAKLARDRQPSDLAAQQPDIEGAAAHEGQLSDGPVGQAFHDLAAVRPRQRKAHDRVRDIAHRHAVGHVTLEPAHVPFAQVIRPHDPPGAVAPVEQCQIALQTPGLGQHGRQLRAPRRGQFRRHDVVQPGSRPRPRHLEPRKARDVEKTHRLARRAAFSRDDVMGVRPLERRFLLEPFGREVQRHFEAMAHPPARARCRHLGIGGRHLQRTARGQLFVRIGHHETPGIELPGRLLDEPLVLRVIAIARHVHRPGVGLGFAVDHPFRQRLAHAAALQKARHHRAGAPVAALAAHRPHQRVAVGRECEGAVDPRLDAHLLQRGIALEPQRQFVFDPVGLFLEQLHPVIPGRAVHRPVLMLDLVDAQKHALLVLPQIGEALKVDRHRHLEVDLFQHRDRVRHKVMMLERRDRQFHPRHAPHLLRPEACGIDHMFAGHDAAVGDHPPAVARLFERLDLGVFIVFSPPLARGLGIGVHGAGRVDIPLAVGPHRAKDTFGGHDRVQPSRLFRRDKAAIVDADGLEDAIGRLQPFPAVGRARQRQAARHVQPDILPRFLLDRGQQVDRVGLQRRHVRIGVERMNAPRRVPRGPRRQDGPFQKADIAPAEFRQMVKHRRSDDPAPDDDDPIMGLHDDSFPVLPCDRRLDRQPARCLDTYVHTRHERRSDPSRVQANWKLAGFCNADTA